MTSAIRHPSHIVRSPPRTPLFQLIIIVTLAREIPSCDTSQSQILLLEAGVCATHQALTEVVKAVPDMGWIGTIRIGCLAACCKDVTPAD